MAEKQHKVFYRNHILIVHLTLSIHYCTHQKPRIATQTFYVGHHEHSSTFQKSTHPQYPRQIKSNMNNQDQLFLPFVKIIDATPLSSSIQQQINLYWFLDPIHLDLQFNSLYLMVSLIIYQLVSTIRDLQLAGNFSKKGRVLLQFDQRFNTIVKYKLLKEILTLLFNVSQARFTENFIDRIFSFTTEGEAQNRIWFRQFEIYQQKELREIGPRFALELISIDEGLSSGNILYQGTQVDASQIKFKQKIRKSEKKFEKILNEINLKEEEIDVEEND